MATISKKALIMVLTRLRDVRAWHVRRKGDPWAFRQALVLVLEIDTAAALERGIKAEALASFDDAVRADAQAWVRGIG